MNPSLTIGCCGWGYLREKDFSKLMKRKFRSKLQAYIQIFESVEVNSTFYRIPKLSTAEKWRKETDEMNKEFEFTVKASKIITHVDRFGSRSSIDVFSQMLDICAALRARVLLLQSPESFKPTAVNKNRLERFFSVVNRGGVKLAWEPRGKWWGVRRTCKRFMADLNSSAVSTHSAMSRYSQKACALDISDFMDLASRVCTCIDTLREN